MALRKKAELQFEYIETGNRTKLTLIEIETNRLEGMLNIDDTGVSTDQALVHIGRWLGYRLNPKEITAKEYFVILKEYGEANKKDRHSRGGSV